MTNHEAQTDTQHRGPIASLTCALDKVEDPRVAEKQAPEGPSSPQSPGGLGYDEVPWESLQLLLCWSNNAAFWLALG